MPSLQEWVFWPLIILFYIISNKRIYWVFLTLTILSTSLATRKFSEPQHCQQPETLNNFKFKIVQGGL
jgi:hypothetical protein